MTVDLAEGHCKPVLHVDMQTTYWEDAIEVVVDWVDAFNLQTINVAGSRETSCFGIQETVGLVIHGVLKEVGAPPCDSGTG